MWVCLIGAPGTCKAAVAERIRRDVGFIVEREAARPLIFEAFDKDQRQVAFPLQLALMLARYRLQRDLQKRAQEEDILQVRSFWDTQYVYTTTLYARGYLTVDQLMHLQEISMTLASTLEAPTAVIYLHGTPMMTGDRMALSGQKQHDEERLVLTSAYQTFSRMIRVPVIDVEVRDAFEAMIEEVKVGLDSARATSRSVSLWPREFLK